MSIPAPLMKEAPFRAGDELPHYLKGLLAESHALTGHSFELYPTVKGIISAVREILAKPRCRQLGAVAGRKLSPTGSEDREATHHIATLLALRSWYNWHVR